MKKWKINLKFVFILSWILPFIWGNPVSCQTTIPNSDFEIWYNHGSYENPKYWDSDNKTSNSIPLFGKTVVSKDPDHSSGRYSAKLETKNITFIPFGVPGILTLGRLFINLTSGTYSLTGGVPINDAPTHLKGFYKFYPEGNDSCIIAIGLSRTVKGVRDSLAYGYFATRFAANTWTPFSALIQYDTTAVPDSFNILMISSAVQSPTAGTTLFVDQLSLDYSLGMDSDDPEAGLEFFQNKADQEIILFFDFPRHQNTFIRIYDMMGQRVTELPAELIQKRSVSVGYTGLPKGCYILVVVHDKLRFSRKFLVI